MTCRHKAGDPSCSSSPEGARRAAADAASYAEAQARTTVTTLKAQIAALAPDPTQFEIDEAKFVGPHLVARVLFPNCAKCAYEGKKVLVYLDIDVTKVLKWKRLDPHFRAAGPKSPQDAPPPAARFPASPEGWSDAIAYAVSKGAETKRGK